MDHDGNLPNVTPAASANPDSKKKKPRKATPAKPGASAAPPPSQQQQVQTQNVPAPTQKVIIETLPISHDGHMTSEEIERHLEAKQSLRDLIPEKTPLTVPVELFSNEPSVMECSNQNLKLVFGSV